MTLKTANRYKVLIEGSKILTPHRDGHKRYILDLLNGLLAVAEDTHSPWEFYVYFAVQGNVAIKNIIDIQKIVRERDPFGPAHKKKASVYGMGYRLTSLLDKIYNDYFYSKWKGDHKKTDPFKSNRYDLLHLTIPQFYTPFLEHVHNSETCKLLTTVHDLTHLNFPEFHTQKNIDVVTRGLNTVTKKRSAFTTISQSTANDLLAAYPSIGADNVHVVYPGIDHNKFRRVADDSHIQRVRKKYRIGQAPFILSLCTLEPRKNIYNTIKAFLLLKKEMPALDARLVVAGGRGWKVKELFDDVSLHSPDVVFTGFVDEEDLPIMYFEATALCYVSFYEGFGLPLVEAMSCGTPVVYGNNSSMPEIAQGAGLPADPNDIYDIKGKYQQILTGSRLREKLSAEALERSKKYSVETFIQRTLAVYEKVLNKSTP